MDIANTVQRAQDGDAAAFAELAAEFARTGLATAMRITDDRALAEEAVQEALTLAWRQLGSLSNPLAFPAWFKVIVERQAMRTVGRSNSPSPEPLGLSLTPEEAAHYAQRARWVRAAADTLPHRQRAVVERYYLQGMSTKEIAVALRLPEGTVKRRLHEAREHLRGRLMRTYPDWREP